MQRSEPASPLLSSPLLSSAPFSLEILLPLQDGEGGDDVHMNERVSE